MPSEPAVESFVLCEHTRLLLDSYRRLTGTDMLREQSNPVTMARALYEAGFAVVSHDSQPDPVFNYANLAAQRIFEMDWETFTQLPSRLSADSTNRDERARLMERVRRDGYIDDYSGVRISATGKRFMIRHATVWNLVDGEGHYLGQAARFVRAKTSSL